MLLNLIVIAIITFFGAFMLQAILNVIISAAVAVGVAFFLLKVRQNLIFLAPTGLGAWFAIQYLLKIEFVGAQTWVALIIAVVAIIAIALFSVRSEFLKHMGTVVISVAIVFCILAAGFANINLTGEGTTFISSLAVLELLQVDEDGNVEAEISDGSLWLKNDLHADQQEDGSYTFEVEDENVVIDGDVEITGDQIVDGNQTVTGDQTVVGDSIVEGNQTVVGDSTVEGNQTVVGDSHVEGNLTVDGDTDIKGDLNVDGDVTVGGCIDSSCEDTTTTTTPSVTTPSVTTPTTTTTPSVTTPSVEEEEHECDFTLTKTVAATCTEDGYKLYECSCGESYKETIAATGHSWSAWVVTKEPTTTAYGTETRTCSSCGATETRDIDKLEVVKATASINWGDHIDGATIMYATVTVSGDTSVSITSNLGVSTRKLSDTTYHVEITLPEGSGVAALEVSGDNLDSVESSKTF